jgi:hypothetical protein
MVTQTEDANSHTTAVLFMVGITILLAALVVLLFQIPAMDFLGQQLPVFEIRSVDSTDEITGTLNYDSRVRFVHNGTENYQNDRMKAVFFKNGGQWSCVIETLSGAHFIPSHHHGVQWMGGSGCSGTLFTPGEQVVIDFTDGTFRPGDTVRMDIMDKDTERILSTHSFRVKN